MKRLILILAILASVVAMCAGCAAMAKGVCDGCGQTEKLSKFGYVYHYCDDCIRFAKLLY